MSSDDTKFLLGLVMAALVVILMGAAFGHGFAGLAHLTGWYEWLAVVVSVGVFLWFWDPFLEFVDQGHWLAFGQALLLAIGLWLPVALRLAGTWSPTAYNYRAWGLAPAVLALVWVMLANRVKIANKSEAYGKSAA